MSDYEAFVHELIGYIFKVQDKDDDNLSAEIICRKLYKYGLIENVNHEWRMKYRPKHRWPATVHNGRADKEDWQSYTIDRKAENCSEIPNNSTISKMEQVDEPQTPYDNCQSCLHWVHDGYWYCECNECRYEPKDEPQTDNPCDGCVCDDGKHLMYCMNCKGIAWKTEPPKVEDVPKAGRSDMSEIDKMIKMVDGILGDDDLCEGCEYVIEGLSCDECRRKYADKIIKILRNEKRKLKAKDEPQTERSE